MSVRLHASYNLIGSAIPLLLAVVTIPIYIKLIGPEKYGILSLAFLFLGYFGLFDLGLGKATAFRISELTGRGPQEQADVVSTALIINIAMGAFGAAAVWLASMAFFDHLFESCSVPKSEINAALPLLGLSLPVAMITGVLTGALQGREMFSTTNSVSVLSTSVFQVAPIIVAAYWTDSLQALLATALIARVVALLVLLEVSRRVFFRVAGFRWRRSEVPLLFGFGGWILADGLLTPALAMFDRFAIGAALGGAAVAVYTVPYQLAQRVTILPAALLGAIFPKLPTAAPDARGRYAEDALRFLLAALTAPVTFGIAVMEPAFRLWLGDQVGMQSAAVGGGILLAFWINALAWVPLVFLQGVGRPAHVTKVHLVELLPYFAVLLVGIYSMGIMGAVIALIFRNILDLLLLMRAAGLQTKLREIPAFLFFVVVSLAITWTLDPSDFVYWALQAMLVSATMLVSWFKLTPQIRSSVAHSIVSVFDRKKG